MPEMQGKESLKERRERYETAFLEYLMENDACGTSIEDWAAEHGLSLELLLKTGRNNGFDIPRGKSVRKQREDFSSSFEPVTVDTEISPVVRRERLKEDERKRTLKEKTAVKPQEETSPAPAPRKRGRPKKVQTTGKETAKTTTPMQHGKEKMTLQEALKEARAVEQDGILYLIADSPEQLKTLEGNRAQSMEIARNATGFKGAIEIVSSLPEKKKEEEAAAKPQEEKTLKEEEKKEAMPGEKNAEERKPSFMMMDGKAALEDDGFHMELSVDMTDAEEIKAKIDLLYSAYGRFRELAGNG